MLSHYFFLNYMIELHDCSIPTQVLRFFSLEKDLGTCIQMLLLMIFDELDLMARASSWMPEVTASSPRGVPQEKFINVVGTKN